MIKKLYIENYSSIKDRIEIDFTSSMQEDNTYYYNYFDYNGTNILKTISFYGMNASGKSAIIAAFSALKELVAPMNQFFILPYNPFLLSNDTKNAPTSFSISFTLDNKDDSILYKYYVKYNANQIIEEKFEKMTSQKPSLLYLRKTNINGETTIQFGQNASNLSLLDALKKSVIKNRTFLSMFYNFDVPDFHDAFDFFSNRFIVISPEVNRFIDIDPSNIMNDEKHKEFTLNLLKSADFNIKGFHTEKTNKRNNLGMIIETNSLFLEHEGGSIEFIRESLGTKKIVLLSEILYTIFSKPSVLIVDELESSLHPELTRLIVECFLDDSINTSNSQLVFASHETSLLDLNLLRRDQIYFVYKDESTSSTYIRPLKDYKVRLRDNVEKSYISGRYGTSPNIDLYYLNNAKPTIEERKDA